VKLAASIECPASANRVRIELAANATSASVVSAMVSMKRRLLMPVLRWFYEFSRDNFERQRRVNQVLFACVQELAIETARLRRQVRQLSDTAIESRAPDHS